MMRTSAGTGTGPGPGTGTRARALAQSQDSAGRFLCAVTVLFTTQRQKI